MNLAELLSLDVAGPHRELLQRATLILGHLPEPTPGSQITLAFGGNPEVFAASLLAAWAKGHGVAVVENDLRERIMPVLDRPQVATLIHDTGSGRKLQPVRMLASTELPAPELPMPTLTASPLLTSHIQTDDGIQHWCSWDAQELREAIRSAAAALAPLGRPAAPEGQTPGLISSLFANTLVPLHQGEGLAAHTAVDARGLSIPGVPTTVSEHTEQLDAILTQEGITDVAVTCTGDGRALTALSGPGAAALAKDNPDARAFTAIPRDPNGQALTPEIFMAFGLGRAGGAVTRQLQWQHRPPQSSQAWMRCRIPDNYVFYEGHFTDYPVLAGGAQLHELVLPCLRLLCATLPPLEKLDNIKFLARVQPGDLIDVSAKASEDRRSVTFEVHKAEHGVRCTSGRLHFATPITDFAGANQEV
jgi:3-hydroxymyristoyl/3-hydroxydecanoyl-(acyl carrier protein) dehydratase